MWFITNGPVGKGGDIHGDVIREMAVELNKDPNLKSALTSNLAMVGLRGLRNCTISNSTCVRVMEH